MPSLRQRLVAMLLRRYPLYSGAGTLANSKFVTTLAGTSHENIWCPTVGGGEVLAPLNDYIGRAAYYCGDLDPKVSWVCKRIVKRGDTVCDIGANIGIVTMLMSHLVGDLGSVFSFEPNPACYNSLVAAVARNRITNVHPQQLALGSRNESRYLSIPTENAGAASLNETASRTVDRTIQVTVRTLDDFVTAYGIKSVRFMKIDVEGFESEVLRGGHQMLDLIRPQAILFEMNQRSDGPLIQHPVFSTLDRFEYAFLSLPKGMLKVRPQAFDPNVATSIPGHDVLALAKGPSFEPAIAALRATI